jgi:hypothetical protein
VPNHSAEPTHNGMRLCFCIAVLVIAISSQASDHAQGPRDRALAGAVQIATAMKAQDAKAVARLTLPDLVWAIGGEAKMIEILQAKFERAKEVGIVKDTLDLGPPSALGVDGKTHYVFIPYVHLAQSPTRRVRDEAYFLAISDDTGVTWHYVDGIQLTEAEIRRAFIPGYRGDPPAPKVSRNVD